MKINQRNFLAQQKALSTLFLPFFVNERNKLHCKFQILVMRKNSQNEHIIVHFEYAFTCHYSKTVWLTEKRDKNYSL